MAGKTKYSVRQVRLAIANSRGNKMVIAERLGCARQTVDNLLMRYPELLPELEQERETILDTAENKLYDLVNAGEIRAILFVLETLGKNRGWAKRTEVTGANGGALQLSNETLMLIEKNGLSVGDVLKQFEALIKESAA